MKSPGSGSVGMQLRYRMENLQLMLWRPGSVVRCSLLTSLCLTKMRSCLLKVPHSRTERFRGLVLVCIGRGGSQEIWPEEFNG